MAHTRVGAGIALLALLGVAGWLFLRGERSAPQGPAVATASAAGTRPNPTQDRRVDSVRLAERPVVVLVHGLGRRPVSMAPLGRNLVEAGFRVVNLGYPSWTESADSLVGLLADSVASCCSYAGNEVNFVTHSLGGILVRKYLEESSPDHVGRVVMLSPPNGGSEIIDFVRTVPGLRALLGPTGATLGTDSTSLPNRLGPVRFQLGVITGDRSLNPVYSWLIPGPDDGKVSVERARIEGVEQFLVVPFSHSFIMNREPIRVEIATFLLEGTFSEKALETWGYQPPSVPSAADSLLGISDSVPGLPPA